MSDPLYNSIEIVETVDGEEMKIPGMDSSSSKPKRQATATQAQPKAMAKVRHADPYLWGIYLSFIVISVIELFSASSTEIQSNNVYYPLIRHGMFLIAGLLIVIGLQRTPYVVISRLSWAFAIVSLGLLILSSLIGININGAQRALRIAGMTIQPAEIVKLAVVCLLATILSRNQRPGGVTNRGIITAAIVVVVFGVALMKNGLTNMLLLMCVSLALMMIGGIQWKKFWLVVGVYALGGVAILGIKTLGPQETSEFEALKQEQILMQQQQTSKGAPVAMIEAEKSTDVDRTETRKNRIKNFLAGVHPHDKMTDDNRQAMLARFAVANGGITGQGPGNSRESARLPLAFSDYIYSIIVEDTGLVGGVALLLLFILLLARAGRIAYKCSRALPAFLILGCAVMIVFQALVHMAIVTGLFPVSGQPLPFISKGGTSVLVMSAAMGIMMSVARFASYQTDGKAINAEINALPEDMQAGNFNHVEVKNNAS